MSLRSHWVDQLDDEEEGIFVVPYRHNDEGWFDYQPLSPVYPTAVWNMTMDATDWERIEALRRVEKYDWRRVQGSETRRTTATNSPGCASWRETTPTIRRRCWPPPTGRSAAAWS